MDVSLIRRKFESIGARVRVRSLREPRRTRVRVDVGRDERGEFFDLGLTPDADVDVIDCRPRMRHLVLMSREPATLREIRGRSVVERAAHKDKFLCGFEERHWFVAGVPSDEPVSDVTTAMLALKPSSLLRLERGDRGRLEHRLRRKTNRFVRQGEWFFLPEPNLRIDPRRVLRREPLRRGRGKPHLCEFLYRAGGETVYVCWQYPNGLTTNQYKKLLSRSSTARHLPWRTMRRNPAVYALGRVSHSDHATIRLGTWHRVEMNAEGESRAMASVAFLD